MRKVFATEYAPGDFRQIPQAAAKEWVHLCIDNVREGKPFWYERDGNSLVIAVRRDDLPGKPIFWFDCQMRVWGGEEQAAKPKPPKVVNPDFYGPDVKPKPPPAAWGDVAELFRRWDF